MPSVIFWGQSRCIKTQPQLTSYASHGRHGHEAQKTSSQFFIKIQLLSIVCLKQTFQQQRPRPKNGMAKFLLVSFSVSGLKPSGLCSDTGFTFRITPLLFSDRHGTCRKINIINDCHALQCFDSGLNRDPVGGANTHLVFRWKGIMQVPSGLPESSILRASTSPKLTCGFLSLTQ
jgi:hypothetical protein